MIKKKLIEKPWKTKKKKKKNERNKLFQGEKNLRKNFPLL